MPIDSAPSGLRTMWVLGVPRCPGASPLASHPAPAGLKKGRGGRFQAMADPYAVLDVPPDSDDEAIRRRYLQLVRQYPPEHHPERFAEIRQAYESLKDLDTRLRHRLFEAGKRESVDAIIEELACRTTRRRL